MFETILSEIKLATAAVRAGKYFTGLSHGGKAATAIGDIGARFFEGGITITANDCSDVMLNNLQTSCDELKAAHGANFKAMGGRVDWVSVLLALVPVFIEQVRNSRGK